MKHKTQRMKTHERTTRSKPSRSAAIQQPVRLTPLERTQTLLAIASLDRADQLRLGKGTDVRNQARPEDRLWELSRIADALEERLRTMEERTRL